MGFLDRVKAGAEQVAARAKEEARELQLRRELGQAHGELGRTAFDLVERGEITHAELSSDIERIRRLKTELAELAKPGAARPAASAPGDAPPSDTPPSDTPPSGAPPATPS